MTDDSYFKISEIKLSIVLLISVQIISYFGASDIIYSDVIDSFISEILKYKSWILAPGLAQRFWTVRFTPMNPEHYGGKCTGTLKTLYLKIIRIQKEIHSSIFKVCQAKKNFFSLWSYNNDALGSAQFYFTDCRIDQLPFYKKR